MMYPSEGKAHRLEARAGGRRGRETRESASIPVGESHSTWSFCRYPKTTPDAPVPPARKVHPLDIERSSKIRALALASRCLTREMKRLKDAPPTREMDESAALEIERLVHLARTMLDPTYSPEYAGPSALSKTRFVPHETPTSSPSKSAASSDTGRGSRSRSSSASSVRSASTGS